MGIIQNLKHTDRVAALEREAEALRHTLVDHAAQAAERDAAVRACEQVVAEREATIVAREAIVAEREVEIARLETVIAACETVVAERETEIARLEATIRRCEQVVLDRESIIRAREVVIQGHEKAMQIVQTALSESSAERLLPSAAALPVSPITTSSRTAPSANSGRLDRAVSVGDCDDGDHWRHETEIELQDNRMTPSDVDQVLAEWKTVAAKYAGQGLTGGQALIEPYIVERRVHDRVGHIIMAIQESQSWYDNVHATELPEVLRLGMIRRGDTVFDCGANQGIHSVSYARVVGPSGRVVAFDPFDLHIDIGRFNAKLNRVRNIDFIHAGVSDKAEQLRVSIEEQCVGTTDASVTAKKISLLPLDTFCSLQPSFIKIDIEGAEINALEGANELLKSEPCMYIEVHPQYISRFDRKPMDLFKHISFDRYQIYIDHPGVTRLSEFHGQFEITQGCALYCIPRSQIGHLRHLRGSTKTHSPL